MMTCRVVLTLAALAAMVPGLAACGGVKVPQHSGYKGKHPKPWEKAKEIKMGSDFKGKAEGDLAIEMDGVPGGVPAAGDDDDEGEDLDVAIELLDPAFNVIAKSDLESE